MKSMLFAAVVLALGAIDAKSQHVVATCTLGNPVPERAGGSNGHVYYVQWAGEAIVCGGRSGFLRCYDPKSKQQRWSAYVGSEIHSFSVASPKDRIYALDDGNTVHMFRISDGHKTNVLSSHQFGRHAGIFPFTPSRIAWIPIADQLLISNFSDVYGENGILFDAATFKKTGAVKTEGFVSKITTDATGRYITTLSNRNNLRIWDSKIGIEISKHGKNEQRGIDAPFISNAMFNGDHTLVYTVDNSWKTGRVFVHDIPTNKQLASFDARNGHVVMDVDFPHGRIALTGTERSLTVLDLTGKVIADIAAVAWQRNLAIAFSPTGKQLAIGSCDNTVRIFDIRDADVD